MRKFQGDPRMSTFRMGENLQKLFGHLNKKIKELLPYRCGLELVPYLESLMPFENRHRLDIIEFIINSRDRSSEGDYSSRSSLNSMFSGSDKVSNLKILPTLDEFERVKVGTLFFEELYKAFILS